MDYIEIIKIGLVTIRLNQNFEYFLWNVCDLGDNSKVYYKVSNKLLRTLYLNFYWSK